jgi:tetratricopeptide (TPR) repeat protein
MKKTKRKQEIETVAAPARSGWIVWWPWLAGLAGLLVVFQVYAPALNSAFVLDDRYLPFFSAHVSNRFSDWVGLLRPLLMTSFWIDYQIAGGADPFTFHVTNVLIHFVTSILAALIVARLVEWAGVAGCTRNALAVFAGALFLLHPLQTEAVAYVAGRSDSLSVMFYYAAFALFLYRRSDAISLWEALGVLVLFGAAIGTKENALTLPLLLLLTDYFWGRGGLMKNRILYGLLAILGAIGGKMVWNILRNESTAGFHTEGMTPATFFFTQCRVIWTYIRFFFVPVAQNVDPDVPMSQSLFDHGAIMGLLALAAVVAAAWIYRNRAPLASFGILIFFLLAAPTASFIPIRDVLSERRLYLPMIGLLLVCCEWLRRLRFPQIVSIGAAAVAICAVVTYMRSEVWASPLTLWTDAVSKSPGKYRPRFQLGYAQFERAQCPAAVQSYEAASHMKAVDNELLVNWALALDCVGREPEAIEKLKQALLFHETAHVHTQIARVYMRQRNWQDALAELAVAERMDPSYDMTYLYRGNIYQIAGDRFAAAKELQHALQLNPDNQIARDALLQLGGK